MTCSSTSVEIDTEWEGTGYGKKKGFFTAELHSDWHRLRSHPYLAERGITEKTAVEFGVGFYAGPGLMHGRLVIPIHNADGELVAYCGRSVDQTQPRYRLPPAFAKSEILFNMHRAAAGGENSVVVVEGFFDCMKVHQAGIPVGRRANGIGSLRTAASRSSWRDSAMSSSCWTATRPAARRAPSSLRSYGRTAMSELVLLPDGVQPDQLPAKDIAKVLQPSANDD